jgi:hypothetical protein
MRALVVLVLSVLAVAVYAACGTDATGIDSCRKIETARCQQALACGISLATPPAVSDSVDGCISFYNDACLHGLEVADPGTPAINACVDAINDVDASNHCLTVQYPQTSLSCAWLTPPPTTDDDASDDADADDGGDDAADAGDAD